MKPNFSIVLIVKNEEKTLPRMLDSLKSFKDRGGEIVICDTGSTDTTAQIARDAGCIVDEVKDKFVFIIDSKTARAINSKFSSGEGDIVQEGDKLFNFSAARNHAASLAANDIISNQDADEVYTKLDIDRICKLIDEGYDQFEYNFVFSHDNFNRPLIQFLQSKFYNRKKLKWTGIVHEVLFPTVSGNIKRLVLGEDILKLEHWQNHETPRGHYLRGLALDCFTHQDNDRNSHYFARELLWNDKPKSAIKEFKRHIGMNRWDAERAQSMIYIGDAYAKLGNEDAQVEWYHKAFALDGGRRESLIKLAYYYRYKNVPMKVAAYVAAAMEIPWNGYYANHKSYYEHEPQALMYWAKGWLGDIAGAQKHILKALEYQPYNTVYLRDTKYYFEYGDNSIEGWMRFPELQWLYNTAKTMNTIIEIGSWKGKSTHALCSGCTQGEVIAVDHFLGSDEEQHRGASKDDAIYKAFLENMKSFDNVTVHRASSEEASKEYADKSFDMVFIDGGHTYNDVKKDINLWKNKAKILLCGHDFCNEWPGVRKAVIEELGDVKTCDSIWYKYVCEFPKVSIVIPTLGREDKLQRLLQKIEENAGYTNYEIIVESDSFENRQGAPKILKRGVEKSTGDFVMFLGNDCIPEKNFLLFAMLKMIRTFPDMDGLVGLNDLYWVGGEFYTHWLASKKLLPYLDGEFFHTGYHHTGCDNELTERCRLIGKAVWAEESKVYHDHPVQTGFKTAEMDAVYKLAYNTQNTEADKKLLYERAEKYGFSVKHSFTTPRRYPENLKKGIDLRKRIKRYKDLKVLNVGVGEGTSDLARQLPFFRFKQLDILDVHQPYLEKAKQVIWDAEQTNFIHADIREFDFSEYDLVLCFDILEHLEKEESIQILEKIQNGLIFIPLEKEFRENVFGVESQDHLSLWTEQDFINLGYTTEVLHNFHGDFSALFAWKTPSKKVKTTISSTRIPKIIYTIWLNENPELPELVQKCFDSQKKLMPEYEHIFITLENCDKSVKYVRDALSVKQWVKASDFLRMFYLYKTGGIYLDADCEMLKSMNELLDSRMFVGREPCGMYANGIVGVEPNHPLIKEYMDKVQKNFTGDGDLIFEPGVRAFTDLIWAADKEKHGITIYPPEYFFPFDHQKNITNVTENTIIFHHYLKSWLKKE